MNEDEKAIAELLWGGAPPQETASAPTFSADTPKPALRLQDVNLRNYDPLTKQKTSTVGYAPFSAAVGAASVDDQDTKVRIYAKKLFPNLPEEDAAKRVGVVEGAIVYMGNDGKMYRADNPDFFANTVADTIGHAEPIVLGSALGAAAGGPIGAIVGAGLGAAGGEGFRKFRARAMYDEPQTSGGNVVSMAKEGGINSLAALLGYAGSRFYQRLQAKDITRLDPTKTAGLKAAADRWGIDLTPAELTDLPSLKGQQKLAGRSPASADTVDDYMKNRGRQVNAGVNKFLNSLSPEDSPEIAGRDLINLSNESLQATRDAAMGPAKPYYEEAFARFKKIPDSMADEAADLMKRPAINRARLAAVKNALNEGVNMDNPKTSLRGLHQMKVVLDEQLVALKKDAVSSAKKQEIRAVQSARDALLDFIERASPKKDGKSLYATAREIAAANMAGADRTLKGVLPVVGNVPEIQGINAPRILMDAERFSPRDIKLAVDTLRKQSPEQADAAVRAFLQDKFAKAGKVYASDLGNNAVAIGNGQTVKATAGAKFWASVMGDQRQADAIKAALTPQQHAAFADLMQVLEATGRAPMTGSDTAWNQAAQEVAKREGGSKMAGLFRMFSPQDIGNRVAEWLNNRSAESYQKRIAEIITSKDGMTKLKELRQLPAGSQARLVKLAVLLGVPLRVSVRAQQDPQGTPPAVLESPPQ